MKKSNCILCNGSQDITTKYTAAFTKVTWKTVLQPSTKMLTLLNDLVIWSITLCEDCSKIAYEKKLKRDINKTFLGILVGIIVGPLCYWFSTSSSLFDDRPIAKIIFFVLSIFLAFLTIGLAIFIIIWKNKLKRFLKTKTIPKNDEDLAFIGMSEEILNSDSDLYKEYIKPKFLELDKMTLDEDIRQKIIKWRKSPMRFEEEKEIEVEQLAYSSKEEIINYFKKEGVIDMLPFPDEWMRDKKLLE